MNIPERVLGSLRILSKHFSNEEMNVALKMLENKGLQPAVDEIQSRVGGFVKADFVNLRPSKPGRQIK